MDGQNAWRLAIAFAVAAGRNSEKARELGGHSGLEKLADRASLNAGEALKDGLEALLLGSRDGARARAQGIEE